MYTKQIDGLKYEVVFESEDELTRFNRYVNPPKDLKAKDVMKILGITRVTLSHYVTRGLLKVNQAFNKSKYTYDYDSVMSLKGMKNE